MIDGKYFIPDDAGDAAAQLADWRTRWPGMGVLALVAEASKHRIAALQAACREVDVPLLGAIFPELVYGHGFSKTGIWLLRLNSMPQHFLIDDLNADTAAGVNKIASALHPAKQADQTTPTLFLIFDGMLPNIGSLLAGLFSTLDHSVKYAGVNAGSETFKPIPCLFDQQRLVGNAVLGLLLPSQIHTVVKHNYPITHQLMSATSTAGNRIDRIDGKPAFTVYQEVIRAEFGIEVTHENFYAYAVHFPFGLITLVDVLVRIPVAFNDDGSLFCIGEVPTHSKLWLLRAPAIEDSDCIDAVTAALHAGAPDAQHEKPLLTFYCAGRRMHFGNDANREIDQLQRQSGQTSLCGALSLGEIDSMKSIDFPRFHNATVVCIA